MGRIRTIKPEFSQSETIGKLSRDARLLFIQLWTVVDDAGRVRGASRMLASILYPYDDDAPSLIEGWMGELEREDCIHRYEVDGAKYLEINNWMKHQKIEKPSASRLPGRDGIVVGKKVTLPEPSPNPPRTLPEPSPASTGLVDEPSVPDLGPRTCTLDLVPKDLSASRTPPAEQGGETAKEPPKKVRKARKLGVYEGTWDFEKFWVTYPRKTDKGDARKAMLAVERSGIVTFEVVLSGITSIDASELQFVKQPGAWLRAEGWGNMRVPRGAPKPANGAVVPFKAKAPPRILDIPPASPEEWSRRLKGWRRSREWVPVLWGPNPEERGCAAPRKLFAEAGVTPLPIMMDLGNGAPQPFDTTPAPKTAPDLLDEDFTQGVAP